MIYLTLKKETIVAVSGGFDILHVGHIRLFEAAKKLGDKLVIILNNDKWLRNKKGYVTMDQNARATILYKNEDVDWVLITKHKKDDTDMSVCRELRQLMPDIFANGGDRWHNNIPEYKLCKKLDIKMHFNVGGKKIENNQKSQ